VAESHRHQERIRALRAREAAESDRHQERLRAINFRYTRLAASTFLVVFRTTSKGVLANEKVGGKIVLELLRVVKTIVPRISLGFGSKSGSGSKSGHSKPTRYLHSLRVRRLSPIYADPTKSIHVRVRVTDRHTRKPRPGVLVFLHVPNLRVQLDWGGKKPPLHDEPETDDDGVAKFVIKTNARLRGRTRLVLFVRARLKDRPVLSRATARRPIEIRLLKGA
jgi:hypothetical protein